MELISHKQLLEQIVQQNENNILQIAQVYCQKKTKCVLPIVPISPVNKLDLCSTEFSIWYKCSQNGTLHKVYGDQNSSQEVALDCTNEIPGALPVVFDSRDQYKISSEGNIELKTTTFDGSVKN